MGRIICWIFGHHGEWTYKTKEGTKFVELDYMTCEVCHRKLKPVGG